MEDETKKREPFLEEEDLEKKIVLENSLLPPASPTSWENWKDTSKTIDDYDPQDYVQG